MKTLPLLALMLTTTLLSACGGGTPDTVMEPKPDPTTINPAFAFAVHEVTIHAGESFKLSANINILGITSPPVGSGLTTKNVLLPTGEAERTSELLVAAANAYSYDTFILGEGLKDAAQPLGASTYDWLKVHVIGLAPAPWLHPEMLQGNAGPIETEFVRLLNEERARGGTCTDSSGHLKAYAPAPAVTLNERASAGLRVKAKDAVLRHWYTHESPEGLGYPEFTYLAGVTGFINEALMTGGYDPSRSDVSEASVILRGFLGSYYHCGMLRASARVVGGQVAVGWYAGDDPLLPPAGPLLMSVMPVSFADEPGPLSEPIIDMN